MSGWRSSSDFEADLREFSEIEVCGAEEIQDEPPPPTISQWKARVARNNNSNTSLFAPDINTFNDEDVTYIFSGRGRGTVSKTYRPGFTHIAKDNSEDDDIRRRIRQETGFIGHNEVIEKKYSALFRGNKSTSDKESLYMDAEETRDVILLSSGSASPITISSDNEQSTEKLQQQQPSKLSSPSALPLSVLRRRARKQFDIACSSSEDDGVTKAKTINVASCKNKNKIHGELSNNNSNNGINRLQKLSSEDQWWSCTSNGSDCSGEDTNTSTSSSAQHSSNGSTLSRPNFFVRDHFNIDKPKEKRNKSKTATFLQLDSVQDFPPL